MPRASPLTQGMPAKAPPNMWQIKRVKPIRTRFALPA